MSHDQHHEPRTSNDPANDELLDALEKVEEAEKEIAKGEVDLREAVRELEALRHEHHGPVVIRVNTKPVTMPRSKANGLEIKEAAIGAGLNIKVDFVLFAELSGDKQEIVKDEQIVDLHHDQCFEAIDNDDHS